MSVPTREEAIRKLADTLAEETESRIAWHGNGRDNDDLHKCIADILRSSDAFKDAGPRKMGPGETVKPVGWIWLHRWKEPRGRWEASDYVYRSASHAQRALDDFLADALESSASYYEHAVVPIYAPKEAP